MEANPNSQSSSITIEELTNKILQNHLDAEVIVDKYDIDLIYNKEGFKTIIVIENFTLKDKSQLFKEICTQIPEVDLKKATGYLLYFELQNLDDYSLIQEIIFTLEESNSNSDELDLLFGIQKTNSLDKSMSNLTFLVTGF